MAYFLSDRCVLRWLETPSVYDIEADELFEVDNEAFEFLRGCTSVQGMDSPDNEFIDFCLREGILTTETVSAARRPVAKSPVPSLRYLELQITDRCNLRCRHCYIGESGTHELSLDVLRRVLSEFEAMQGLRVLITGGEPLLHSGFAELNEALPEFSLRKVLFTNGLLLTRETVKKLKVHEVQVSVDGLREAHDALRGKGSFTAAVDAIEACVAEGLDVSVSTMVHARNLCDFDAMQKLFDKIGVKDWTVDVPCRTGRLEMNSDFLVDPATGGKYLAYGRGEGLHTSTPGFACGLHLMSVNASGKISKCTFYADRPAGTIRNGLLHCWKNILPVRLDALKCDCTYLDQCRGGCRYRAETVEGPLGRDLYRCSLHNHDAYDIIKL
jgi:radical SAM protein with 4Fe4S-binding SPASM domain